MCLRYPGFYILGYFLNFCGFPHFNIFVLYILADTLRFELDQISMTTILILNLFNTVRDTLPQLRHLFDQHWSPALDDFTAQFYQLIRFDQISTLLQYQLENERVSHQEAKQTSKRLTLELVDTRASLEKSRATVDKLKMMLEQAKQKAAAVTGMATTSASAPTSPIQDHRPSLMPYPPQMSLLNHSSGSGTITISNGLSMSSGQIKPAPMSSLISSAICLQVYGQV